MSETIILMCSIQHGRRWSHEDQHRQIRRGGGALNGC